MILSHCVKNWNFYNGLPVKESGFGFLYLFSYGRERLLKIGMSKDIIQRLNDHSTLAPDRKLLAIWICQRSDLERFEQKGIKLLSQYFDRIGDSEVFGNDGILINPVEVVNSQFKTVYLVQDKLSNLADSLINKMGK